MTVTAMIAVLKVLRKEMIVLYLVVISGECFTLRKNRNLRTK